jgi:hypothetical protein
MILFDTISINYNIFLSFIISFNCFSETYLKQGSALTETVGSTRTELQNMSAILTAEQPHKTLYEFTGNLNLSKSGEMLNNPLNDVKGDLSPLGKDQFLMRVCLSVSK